MDSEQLLKIDALDAFRLALELSPKCLEEVAAEMGWEKFHSRRIFSPERYYPTYEDLPKFCDVVGNDLVLLWLGAQADKALGKHVHESVDCPTLLRDAADLFKETSDVGKEASEAIKDDLLEAHELRRLIKELAQVQNKVFSMIGKLRQTERSLSMMLKDKKKT